MNILPDDYVSNEKLERKSQDLITNAYGLLLLDFLKQSVLRIATGKVCDDKNTGAVSYVGSGGNLITYLCRKQGNVSQKSSAVVVIGSLMVQDVILS